MSMKTIKIIKTMLLLLFVQTSLAQFVPAIPPPRLELSPATPNSIPPKGQSRTQQLSDGGYRLVTHRMDGSIYTKEVHPCMLCHGQKYCTLCNGTGRRYTPSGYPFACVCGGSNICTSCHNKGEHVYTSLIKNGKVVKSSKPTIQKYNGTSSVKCGRCEGTGYYRYSGIVDFGTGPQYHNCINCGERISSFDPHMCPCRKCGGK